MSIAFVQASSIGSGGNLGPSGTFTVGLTGVGAGHALFLLYAGVDGGGKTAGDLASVSDGVNTWNHATTDGDAWGNWNRTSAIVYSAYAVASGAVTVTLTNQATTGVALYAKAILLEFSGVQGLDSAGVATNGGNNTGPVTATGGVLANAADLALVVAAANASVTFTNPSGWTSEGLASGFPTYGFGYYLPGATTALSPSFGTIGANNWTIAMSAYTPTSASVVHTLTMQGVGK